MSNKPLYKLILKYHIKDLKGVEINEEKEYRLLYPSLTPCLTFINELVHDNFIIITDVKIKRVVSK